MPLPAQARPLLGLGERLELAEAATRPQVLAAAAYRLPPLGERGALSLGPMVRTAGQVLAAAVAEEGDSLAVARVIRIAAAAVVPRGRISLLSPLAQAHPPWGQQLALPVLLVPSR